MSAARILITGGTGSFGHACVDRLLASPATGQVIVFSRDELKQSEMRRTYPDPRLTFFIGDVRDPDALLDVCASGVDLVLHAAALKQVSTGQNFPREVFKTNARGAEQVIAAALASNIPRVVALSTDKAVAPINAYGKSKAIAEALFIAANATAARHGKSTRFACVRYGNVIASRGSVIPLFLQQRAGGEFRITDLRATRFWMPLEQAVSHVLDCATVMQGGEIWIPKIPSARVQDVAAAIGPGCRLVETGLTAGEKLHESLIAVDEAPMTVEAETHYLVMPTAPTWGYVRPVGMRAVPDGFQYSSADAPRSVTFQEGAVA